MAYTKRTDLNPPDGLVVQLEPRLLPGGQPDPEDPAGGALVLVQQRVKTLTESLSPSIQVTATWVDENLQTVMEAGRPSAMIDFKHSASQHQQDTIGVPVIVRECLMLVLGEPLSVAPPPYYEEGATPNPDLDTTTLIPWDNAVVRSNDIRRAIAIAKTSVAVDLDQVL